MAMKHFALAAFIVLCLAGMACAAMAMVNIYRAGSNRKVDAPPVPWYDSEFNMFNILFCPSDLNVHGLAARRRVIQGLIGFAACFAVGLAVGILSGVAH
jgi:hypothetical protein